MSQRPIDPLTDDERALARALTGDARPPLPPTSDAAFVASVQRRRARRAPWGAGGAVAVAGAAAAIFLVATGEGVPGGLVDAGPTPAPPAARAAPDGAEDLGPLDDDGDDLVFADELEDSLTDLDDDALRALDDALSARLAAR